jgi:hypothetical protein
MCQHIEAQSHISAPCGINVEHILHMELMFMKKWVEAAAQRLNSGS